NAHALTMKSPSPSASLAYSGRWRRRVCAKVGRESVMADGCAALRLHRLATAIPDRMRGALRRFPVGPSWPWVPVERPAVPSAGDGPGSRMGPASRAPLFCDPNASVAMPARPASRRWPHPRVHPVNQVQEIVHQLVRRERDVTVAVLASLD